MNKELLTKRLQEIEAATKNTDSIIQQSMANLNMLEGGKQECLFWLKTIKDNENITLSD